jgi:hypothetical protein
MPEQLLRLADQEGIVIEHWPFVPPIEAIYREAYECPPIIGLSNELNPMHDRAHFRTVLGEELGHHFTTSGNNILKAHTCYRDKIKIAKSELAAVRWAAEFLIPNSDLETTMVEHGCIIDWEIADMFCVDDWLIKFKFGILSEQWKGHVQEELIQEGVVDEDYCWEY